jgi:NTP pyrophosphatase (non-canonical NTP hydrolase)
MTLDEVISLVREELNRAVTKFPTWPDDIIHAGNVVAEESGELAKAILQCVYEPHKSGLGDVQAEAVQTAAMAIRFLMSMDRYQLITCDQHRQGMGA